MTDFFDFGIIWEQQKINENKNRYQKAMITNSKDASNYCNLGSILYQENKIEKAIKYYEKAIAIDPNYVDGHCNLGFAEYKKRNINKAITHYKKAIAIDPNHITTNYNLALCYLMIGDLQKGWKYHKWRLKYLNYKYSDDIPVWDGSFIKAGVILIHCEQGLGDDIQFIRYAKLIKDRGMTVIVLCPDKMLSLLKTVDFIDYVTNIDELIPPCDYQISLFDLPMLFNTTLDTIPAEIPYLFIDSVVINYYKKQMHTKKLKIGIVWKGNPTHKNNHDRSIELTSLTKLFDINDCIFFGLRDKISDNDLLEVSKYDNFIDMSDKITDFIDTGAIISNLDLVISVDTSVVHLAGALNCPVWIMLPSTSDWRWMLNRKDSPWYPTACLFRQSPSQDWDTVIDLVIDEINMLLDTFKIYG